MIDPLVQLVPETASVAAGTDRVAESTGSKIAEPQLGELTFLDAVSQVGTSAMSNLRQAESISMSALRGDAGPREVAEAVMEAEKSLQIAIAVRNKIVTAYMEISRMAI
ncbi:MAG: flagellar hook-basal body complex protein FliE [Rhizobiaceae bacterium]